MNISIDTLINIGTLLLGGGGGAFFTWRWQRAKAKAEAKEAEAEAQQAETSAAKEMQDVYQQLIYDVKADRDEQKQYIAELKEDRRHLREERDELRDRIDKTDENVRNLQEQVAKNSAEVELMRPFVCGVLGCKLRKPVAISAAPSAEKPKKQTKKKEA